MRTVRLSLKCARELFAEKPKGEEQHGRLWHFDELASAIARCERASRVKARLRAPKEEKRKTRWEVTSKIHAAVMRRAGLKCEGCGLFMRVTPLEMDHFFGRVRMPQSVSNCWALCWHCHRAKTANAPTAAEWLQRFISHCARYGYDAEVKRAAKRLAFVEARGAP